MRDVVQLFLTANTILLMHKWNHTCRQGALTAFRRYYLLKNKLSDRMIKQLLLNSIIAKYRDLSVSRRSIICLSLWLRQIIDLLATDKSRYFAQPRPIIGNYSATDGATLKAVIFFCVHNFFKKIITLRVKKSIPPPPLPNKSWISVCPLLRANNYQNPSVCCLLVQTEAIVV